MKKTIISSLLSVALLSSYPLVNKVGANTLDDADNAAQTGSKTVASETTDKSQTGHEGMKHDESVEIPEGLVEAENPTYPEGSEVTIQTDHMPEMMGATGEVVGAFDSIAMKSPITIPKQERKSPITNGLYMRKLKMPKTSLTK